MSLRSLTTVQHVDCVCMWHWCMCWPFCTTRRQLSLHCHPPNFDSRYCEDYYRVVTLAMIFFLKINQRSIYKQPRYKYWWADLGKIIREMGKGNGESWIRSRERIRKGDWFQNSEKGEKFCQRLCTDSMSWLFLWVFLFCLVLFCVVGLFCFVLFFIIFILFYYLFVQGVL